MILPRHDADCSPRISVEDTDDTWLNHFTYANGDGYVITAFGLPACLLVCNITEIIFINAFSGNFHYKLDIMQGLFGLDAVMFLKFPYANIKARFITVRHSPSVRPYVHQLCM